MLVRKLPIMVEAHQIPDPDIEEDLREFLQWAGVVGFENWDSGNGNEIEIKTPEGVTTARTGDWIIKGFEEEFWSVKQSVFDKTYEILKTMPQPQNLDFGDSTTDNRSIDGDYGNLSLEE
mgnify:FL=1